MLRSLTLVVCLFALSFAAFAQSDNNLDTFVPKYEIFGTWKKVQNYLKVSESFIRVS